MSRQMPQLRRNAPTAGTVLGVGAALSGTGTNMAAVIVSLQVLAVTQSTLWMSVSLMCTMGMAVLFNPVAGWIADRYPRRTVMIVVSLLCAVLWLPAIAWPHLPLVLVLCATLVNIIDLPYDLAGYSAIPDVTDPDDIPKEYSRFTTGYNVGKLAGPVLGGFAFAQGWLDVALAANAVTFVVCAVLVGFLRFPTRATRLGSQGESVGGSAAASSVVGGWWSDLGAGLAVVRGRVLLVAIAAETFLATIAVNTSFVTNARWVEDMEWGPQIYGWLTAVVGLGYSLGSVLGGFVPARAARRWLVWASAGLPLGWLMVAFATDLWVVFVGLLVGAVCDAVSGVCATTVVQESTESDVRARTFAVFETVGSLANLVGFLTAGVLLGVVSAQVVYGLGAVLTVVATLWLACSVAADRQAAA